MEFVLESNAETKQIRLIVVAIMAILKRLLKEDILYDLEVALSEACTNVAIHAYSDSYEEKKIKVKLKIELKKVIIIEVIDWGDEFSLPENLPDEYSESGRGVYIMRKVMDRLEYERINNQNYIIMHKSVEEEEWKNC
ncbi:MAG: ATP-binding protein [Desulfonauticus sp.]|nr:ATP-binding protein [Desulfonauticus sp.]